MRTLHPNLRIKQRELVKGKASFRMQLLAVGLVSMMFFLALPVAITNDGYQMQTESNTSVQNQQQPKAQLTGSLSPDGTELSIVKPDPPLNHQSEPKMLTMGDLPHKSEAAGSHIQLTLEYEVIGYVDLAGSGYSVLKLRVSMAALAINEPNSNSHYVSSLRFTVQETVNPDYTAIIAHNYLGTKNGFHYADPYVGKMAMRLIADTAGAAAISSVALTGPGALVPGVIALVMDVASLLVGLTPDDKSLAERYDQGIQLTWRGDGTPTTAGSTLYTEIEWLVYDGAEPQSGSGTLHEITLNAAATDAAGGQPIVAGIVIKLTQPQYTIQAQVSGPENGVIVTNNPVEPVMVTGATFLSGDPRVGSQVIVYCDGAECATAVSNSWGIWRTPEISLSATGVHYIQSCVAGTDVVSDLVYIGVFQNDSEVEDYTVFPSTDTVVTPSSPFNHQSVASTKSYNTVISNMEQDQGEFGAMTILCDASDFFDWPSYLDYGTLDLRVLALPAIFDDYVDAGYTIGPPKLEVLRTTQPDYSGASIFDLRSTLSTLIGAGNALASSASDVLTSIEMVVRNKYTYFRNGEPVLPKRLARIFEGSGPFAKIARVADGVGSILSILDFACATRELLDYANRQQSVVDRGDDDAAVTYGGDRQSWRMDLAHVNWDLYDGANNYGITVRATSSVYDPNGNNVDEISTTVNLAAKQSSQYSVSIVSPWNDQRVPSSISDDRLLNTLTLTAHKEYIGDEYIWPVPPANPGDVVIYWDGVAYAATLTSGDSISGDWSVQVPVSPSLLDEQRHSVQASYDGTFSPSIRVRIEPIADESYSYQPPSITFTDPTGDTSFTTGHSKSMRVHVSASDPDVGPRGITNVWFQCWDENLYDQDPYRPEPPWDTATHGTGSDWYIDYTLTAHNPPGLYNIVAKAETVGDATNTVRVYITMQLDTSPPDVTITGPSNGYTFTTTETSMSVPVSVSASDPQSGISGVQINCNGGTFYNAEYLSGSWWYVFPDLASGAPPIQYTFQAVATNDAGLTSSTTITAYVKDVNQPPTVYFTNPSDGTTMLGPTQYTFHVNAEDPELGPSGITEVLMIGYDINDPEGNIPPLHAATHGSQGDWYYTFGLSGDTTWEISARATDSRGLVTWATIHVIVHDTPRFTYTPPDFNAETRDQFTLKWTATTVNPRNYVIYLGSTQVASGNWQSYTDILYTASQQAFGTYTYTITIYNTAGYSQSDSVTVTVADYAAPVFIVAPGSLTYERGTTGHTLTWQAEDHNPGTYEITYYPQGRQDESCTWTSGSWTNGAMITTNVDGLAATTWYFACKVKDTYGHIAVSTVSVTVQYVPPTFTYTQPSITVEIWQSFTLRWRATDAAPNNYVITRSGTQVASGTWASGVDITYTSSLGSGTYTYTITVYDNGGSSATSSTTVTVVVDAYSPTFTYRQPNIGTAIGAPFTLKWTATDAHPSTYVITRNGVQIASGTWQSGVPITKTDTRSGTGTFSYTITVYDQYGHSSSATCTVTVKNYY